MTTPLTGDALIARVNELKPASEATIAIECGYVSEGGKARLSAFKTAVLDAHGLGLGSTSSASGKGRPLSFAVKVGTKGQIMLSGGYSELIGLAPGDQVDIRCTDGGLLLCRPDFNPEPAAACAVAGAVITYDSAPAQEQEPVAA
jgi:hypothetical protein